MEQAEIQRNVCEKFCDFLEENKQRKTPERLAVLECIYNQTEHFNVESLYVKLRDSPGNISRATVYNTIELLLECDLLTKHQFGKTIAQYEKSYQSKQHDHLICEDCNKVFEFCDPRIQQIQDTAEELANLKISHHALNFYGRCDSWQENGKCEHRRKTRN